MHFCNHMPKNINCLMKIVDKNILCIVQETMYREPWQVSLEVSLLLRCFLFLFFFFLLGLYLLLSFLLYLFCFRCVLCCRSLLLSFGLSIFCRSFLLLNLGFFFLLLFLGWLCLLFGCLSAGLDRCRCLFLLRFLSRLYPFRCPALWLLKNTR